jgi:hypothetical protein
VTAEDWEREAFDVPDAEVLEDAALAGAASEGQGLAAAPVVAAKEVPDVMLEGRALMAPDATHESAPKDLL